MKLKLLIKKATIFAIQPESAKTHARQKPINHEVAFEKALKAAIGFEMSIKKSSQKRKHKKFVSRVKVSSLKKIAKKLDKKVKLTGA